MAVSVVVAGRSGPFADGGSEAAVTRALTREARPLVTYLGHARKGRL
ncbi:hypothetical protein [Streptomyces decoyicus]